MKCNYVDRTVSFLFKKLGYHIGLRPGYFIIVPLLVSGLLATGLQQVRYEQNPEYLFSPINGPAKHERQVIEELFPMNLSANFDVGRMTRITPFARVIIEAKDGRSVLEEGVFREILELDEIVRNISIVWDEREWRYEHICARKKGKCFSNEILKMGSKISDIESGTYHLKYPLMVNDMNYKVFFTAAFLGGVSTDDIGIIENARSMNLLYFLENGNKKMAERAELWENAFLDLMTDIEFENFTIGVFTSLSLGKELDKNTQTVMPFTSITIIIMLIFSVGTCMMMDWVRSKPWLGVIGCMSSGLAVGAAFGLVIYCGLEFIGINMAAPFLMLGIGMDDTFVLLAAWRRTDPKSSVPDRMAQSFSEAGVSITITSLTNFISFCIGAITPFPSVQIFCVYTATAVLFTYIYHVTFFGGVMALCGHAEKRNLHALVCVPAMPSSLSKNRSFMFRLFCSGGRNPEDPDNAEDNKEHTFMIFFRDTIGNMLSLLPVKVFTIFFFLTYLGVGIWGCTQIREGLERHRLVSYNSYSVKYFHLEDKYYRLYPYRIQVVVNGSLNYADPAVQNMLEQLLNKVENTPYTAGSKLTESWLRVYQRFAKDERASFFLEGFNLTKKEDFIRGLRNVFFKFRAADYFKQDILFNEDNTEIIASRFVIQAYHVLNTNSEKNLVTELRKIADSFPFQVTVFQNYFIFWDQFLLVRSTSIQAISVAAAVMMIISLLFIPSTSCALWVAFSIVSIEIGVIGYMTLWGVNLDSISMINLIMCIGFSVDYSAHISYAYISSKKKVPNDRMRNALHSLGLPILQGSLSTIIGIVALALAPSYIFVVFFKTVFLVIAFGALHGIFLLPVLLSITDSCCTSATKKEKTKPVAHPFFIQPKEGDIIHTAGSFIKNGGMFIPRPSHAVIASPEVDGGRNRLPSVVESGGMVGKETASWVPEKDLGIGTSGEDSSNGSWKVNGELRRNSSTTELTPVVQTGDSPSSREREDHVNTAFVPDDDLKTIVLPARRESHSAQGRMSLYHINDALPRRESIAAPPRSSPRPPPSAAFRRQSAPPAHNRDNEAPLARYMARLNSGYIREFQLPL